MKNEAGLSRRQSEADARGRVGGEDFSMIGTDLSMIDRDLSSVGGDLSVIDRSMIDRRRFLGRAAFAAAGLAALPTALLGCSRGDEVSHARAASAAGNSPGLAGTWRTQITTDKEPGEPMLVSGTIYAADGRTPLEGVTLYVYHTDARGLYSDASGDPRDMARLRGRMTTGSGGRYEFRTIKPAPYPGRTMPAHIHTSIKGPQLAESWITDYWFDDDPLLPRRERERHGRPDLFSPILKLTRGSDGVLRGVRDIKAVSC